MENFEEVLESVRSGRGMPNGESPMETLPSCLRGAFRAPEGYHFVASDYSQIELRVLAWLTDCAPMLAVFAADLDPYKDFAQRMYSVSYDEVTKAQRQIAKPAVLSCGYGSGGGKWATDPRSGDEIKTGLWGYAESMGVNMTQQEAWDAVTAYREAYREVPGFWYSLQDQVAGLLQNPTHGITTWRNLIFTLWPDKLLRVTLPSSRNLHYLKPDFDQDGNITYDGENPITKQRCRRRLYGSLLTENLVQAIARDVMAVGMTRAVDAGFSIVGHTHDEILCLERIDSQHNLTYLNNMMVGEISWCANLPLKSEGWEGAVYRK